MKHIEPSRLFALAEGFGELEELEQGHFETCEDCQQVVGVFRKYLCEARKKKPEEGAYARGTK